MDPLEKYPRELRSIWGSGSGVPETSYYPALRDLMNEVGAGLAGEILRALGGALVNGACGASRECGHGREPSCRECSEIGLEKNARVSALAWRIRNRPGSA